MPVRELLFSQKEPKPQSDADSAQTQREIRAALSAFAQLFPDAVRRTDAEKAVAAWAKAYKPPPKSV